MGKRIVIALGGNALGKNLEEQMHAVKTTASAIAHVSPAARRTPPFGRSPSRIAVSSETATMARR